MALARALAGAGVDVRLYTAADHEPLPGGASHDAGVVCHPCLWRFAAVRPRPLRRAAVAAGWLAIGMPACLARTRRGDVVHVHGWFRPALYVPLVLGVRLRRGAFVFSPHTSFNRSRPGRERIVRWLARRADVVLSFSEADRRCFTSWRATVAPAPFPFVVPAPEPALVSGWRRRWLGDEEGGRVVLLAGQMRADKGADLLLRAVAAAGEDDRPVLALVGEDVGALGATRRLAEELGVTVVWDEGYQPLDRFVAALAAADVVVCPYRVASQSGVLALTHAVGRPSVVTDVGGLPELGTVTVPPDDPVALGAGLRQALRGTPPGPPAPPPPGAVAEAYLSAYRRALLG